MKHFFIFLLFFSHALIAYSQSSPAVVYEQYRSAKTAADKNKVMDACFESFRDHELEPTLHDLINMHAYFKKEGDETGIGTGRVGLFLAYLFEKSGDYKNSLYYALPALHNFEQLNDTSRIIDALIEIAAAFTRSENISQGLYYYNECKLVIEAYANKTKYPLVLNNIADCYNGINYPDSALPIINTALNLAEKNKSTEYLGLIYTTMGETHLAKGDDELARAYLLKSLPYTKQLNDWEVRAESYCSLARSFFNSGEYDIVIGYASNAVKYAAPNYKKELMHAYEWLYQAYENKGEQDSVYKYFRLAAAIKDSLFTVEKTRSQQEMHLQEQLRKDEIQAVKIKQAAERKQGITYILIGIGIISFIGLFLLLSRNFITNPKLIKALGIITLLIVFEFFNLLLHPFLEDVTGHSALLMLLALVSIAIVLAPVHHKIEKWTIDKLVEKNKSIRLARAKRTIELLEKENPDNNIV